MQPRKLYRRGIGDKLNHVWSAAQMEQDAVDHINIDRNGELLPSDREDEQAVQDQSPLDETDARYRSAN